MSRVPLPAGLRVILLDIEGTTTPIAFVHDVLFGYARASLRGFLDASWSRPKVQAAVAMLAAEHAVDASTEAGLPVWDAPASVSAAAAYALWLMARDRKSPGLKALQGLVWEHGYRAGQLRGELFADVAPAFAAWRARDLEIAIYSSGSVLAQQLLFSTTASGDLTTSIAAFFDTAVGPKRQTGSYTRIAAAMNVPPSQILFVSDVAEELRAAASAGMQTALSVRPGNAPAAPPSSTPVVQSLLELT